VVPGSNTTVEEKRGDFMLQDTWTLGTFELDLGLGSEVSQISQTGDAVQKRDFFFIKPLTMLTWSPNRQNQTRLRLVREVAQLNFAEFVSSAVFEDNDLSLGNPDLRPETTWVSEISQEHRFGEVGVVTVTAFHHWITDVQDLLPITDEFEVPGNIGDGRRWGIELEGAMPLTWLGLTGSRLDVQVRWQDSTVTDPVTGEGRVLSSSIGFPRPFPFRDELELITVAKYRQDFRAAKISWGGDIRERRERPRYKVNEVEILDEGTDVNLFIETTRYWDVKIRLEGQNLTNVNQSRDRYIYQGLRDLTPIRRTVIRNRNDGSRFFISVSGNF
jgi:outer membrane receptor protein involved in Fe transport